MSLVVEVIAEHLLSNRRLVVPAFGAFMVKESGERLFSELLCTDDGVLASLLHDRGLSEMEVAVTIDRFIFEVRHELEEYGYCRLGDVGTLRIEPETKVLRLYPPVYGEEQPKQQDIYVPAPISDENDVESEGEEEEKPTEQQPKEPQQPKPKRRKPRRGADWVIVLAVIALVVALLSIAYGFYVSSLGSDNFEADDEAMSELRMTLPEGEIGKE